ncbi:N-6 DNA methylase [Treponema endosymbiont of Eucomonympha sp.]|uniref:N-6 DNA methylase n=1 Tax=Treponema endosymbiont of Eucomonympha sp. TaxID=1580831 RepID=UPI0007850E57|nr:N-6 DNA methylase [Treponema endosymbiont of Eucomonympha sp.]
MNERKTETLVRNHFSQFSDSIIIEEQRSDNPKIDKLLKNASKKGGGKGYPEFIISYKTNPDLLIVIECKADITKHESKEQDKYADFAVDGALLYSAYLSKGYDVLSIAVSGETKNSLRVSHFLQLKNEKVAVSIFDDTLLSLDEYLNAYLKSPEKFRQDYNKLLDFTKQLNEKLHGYKILESQRSLLISSILIALENPAFKRSYASHKKPENLAASLVQTVSDELETANISGKKLENLQIQFGFIKIDTSLSKTENILREIIDEIDENVNTFIKTHQYFDVLGQLYIEFLRYANSDKGLGIVLTPPHITELFADLAQVNKNSIAYDNCTGTGGFLIAAMRRMIADAKGDEKKVKEIKAKQLIGTEYQAHIFALAVSNMYIHQDGKTNIMNGSCFDDAIIEAIKAKKPTVGFLNPPYKANKKTDTDELEFVLNNLECLVDGGTCIAIVPMQSALVTNGKGVVIKKELLKKHTLEAVLSMPGELFFNSDVGEVTCIMIFTAHKAHPKNKTTFFGYYKDDGFVKRKTKGRIDALGKWTGIKEYWLTNFINRKDEPGLSVNEIVNAYCEWSAENYMETDYSSLCAVNFEDTLHDYATFLFANKVVRCVSDESLLPKKPAIDVSEWQYFALTDLFTITGSETTPLLDLEEYGKGKYPYVTTQATNNGVASFFDYFSEQGNVLTVDSAVLGYCSYQSFNFSASDHVEKLIPIFDMNKYTALFLVTILNKEQYRYNYGRKCSQSRMKTVSIKLPSKNQQPDFEYMENYIKSLPYSKCI